jgi:hypothetical protein
MSEWLQSLDAPLQTEASLADFKDTDLVPMPKSLAQAYVDTKRMVGRDKIPMPTNDAEYATVFERLGKPKTPAEYEVALPPDLPETVKPLMQQDEQWFREVAHAADLTTAQAKRLWAKYSEKITTSSKNLAEQFKQEMAATETQLRAQHGTAYDAKLALANRAMKELGGEELVQLVAHTGLGRHPEGMKMLIRLGEIMAEEQGIDTNTGMPRGSAASLEQQLNETMADKAYFNRNDPRHAQVVRQALELRRQIDVWQKRAAA